MLLTKMDLLNYQYLDKMNNNIGILCYEGEAALRGEPRMQSMSSVVANHRTGPPPISPSKRKHSGEQADDDIDCDNEHVAKMSRLFAAQLELAKLQRPPAFLWEDAGLSSCDLAMIKVSLPRAAENMPWGGGAASLPTGTTAKTPGIAAAAPSSAPPPPAIGLHGNHLYTHMPSLAMDQPLALTKNSMDAARTASISPALGPIERQQNRPSVITCASANNRNCNLSHCPVSHNGCTSSLPANYRRPSNTNTACDPVIEEHFRRSLGKNYKEPEPVTNSVSITGSVDDHFAKALGETWLQIKAKGSGSTSPEPSPSSHMVNHNHSPSLVS
ncbi:hypothetical protein SKAU_G00176000 [Synaphobranchus kaupii]|uniref:Transcription cofactor vestigial-like protein 4 n=1 Tax=Synaphobranchus kaupii TaxID=118154 RepID=A0A9Q1FLD2_SYNKA|nr:hypothetical protein SKAU_G00176000 [Synaphobranchus kaupii]